MARLKFLCDADRCIDCNACVTACKNENEVPWGINRRRVVTINDGKPGAGGGGVSKDFAAPSWQTGPGVVNSATVDTCGAAHNQQCREVPDVSASADPTHGDVIF